MLGLRAARSLRSALPKTKNAVALRPATRAIASSSCVRSDKPPAIYGEGSKAGEIPTDFQQATGIERLQLLGQMEGVDVFNTGPLMMSKAGTVEDPTLVPSYSGQRIVGCNGWPTETHDMIWLTTSNDRKNSRCPECGNVFKLQFLGEEGGHHHH